MKILLPINRVVDYNVTIQVKKDHSGVDIENAPHAMNPFDAIAVEAGIQLKEQYGDIELIVVSIGDCQCHETCRQALAMGADQAIVIDTNVQPETLTTAKILAQICQQHAIDLVIMGKQAIDYDHNQTGQMLAALLDWPQGCHISSIDLNQNKVNIEREVDNGLENLILTLPCVLTTDLRLNQPRFAKLPDIIKAKSKPLTIVPIAQFNLENEPQHQVILQYNTPPQRQPGKTLNDVDELIAILKQQGVMV